MPNWIAYVLVGAAAIGALYLYWQREKKRRAALAAYLEKRGFSYTFSADSQLDWYRGEPFEHGRHQRATHVIVGKFRERAALMFEYSYKTGDRDNEKTHHFVIASVTLPASRPVLQVSRENLGRKLLGAVGVKDLQLESEEFNKRFLIKTSDNRFAYDVLHPRTMQWMLDDARFTDQPFRFDRDRLVIWRPGRLSFEHIEEQLDGMLHFGCDLVDTVPEFVWR